MSFVALAKKYRWGYLKTQRTSRRVLLRGISRVLSSAVISLILNISIQCHQQDRGQNSNVGTSPLISFGPPASPPKGFTTNMPYDILPCEHHLTDFSPEPRERGRIVSATLSLPHSREWGDRPWAVFVVFVWRGLSSLQFKSKSDNIPKSEWNVAGSIFFDHYFLKEYSCIKFNPHKRWIRVN